MKRLVAKCAERFDEMRPGWHQRIDRQRLNMASAHDCVGGQEFGSFGEAKRQMGIEVGRDWGLALNSEDLRFNHHLAWKELGQMWDEEIEVRLLGDELEGAKSEELVAALR